MSATSTTQSGIRRYRSGNLTYHNPSGQRLIFLRYPQEMYRILVYDAAGYLILEKKYNGDDCWLAEQERDGLIALGGFSPEPKLRGGKEKECKP